MGVIDPLQSVLIKKIWRGDKLFVDHRLSFAKICSYHRVHWQQSNIRAYFAHAARTCIPYCNYNKLMLLMNNFQKWNNLFSYLKNCEITEIHRLVFYRTRFGINKCGTQLHVRMTTECADFFSLLVAVATAFATTATVVAVVVYSVAAFVVGFSLSHRQQQQQQQQCNRNSTFDIMLF